MLVLGLGSSCFPIRHISVCLFIFSQSQLDHSPATLAVLTKGAQSCYGLGWPQANLSLCQVCGGHDISSGLHPSLPPVNT